MATFKIHHESTRPHVFFVFKVSVIVDGFDIQLFKDFGAILAVNNGVGLSVTHDRTFLAVFFDTGF
jgi:hypothetical protein